MCRYLTQPEFQIGFPLFGVLDLPQTSRFLTEIATCQECLRKTCKVKVLPQLSDLFRGIKNAGLAYSGVVPGPMEDEGDGEACENLQFISKLFRKLNY